MRALEAPGTGGDSREWRWGRKLAKKRLLVLYRRSDSLGWAGDWRGGVGWENERGPRHSRRR